MFTQVVPTLKVHNVSSRLLRQNSSQLLEMTIESSKEEEEEDRCEDEDAAKREVDKEKNEKQNTDVVGGPDDSAEAPAGA